MDTHGQYSKIDVFWRLTMDGQEMLRVTVSRPIKPGDCCIRAVSCRSSEVHQVIEHSRGLK